MEKIGNVLFYRQLPKVNWQSIITKEGGVTLNLQRANKKSLKLLVKNMELEKETLSLIFPEELLADFEVVLAHELAHIQAKEDFIEIVFDEKNIPPLSVDAQASMNQNEFISLEKLYRARIKTIM